MIELLVLLEPVLPQLLEGRPNPLQSRSDPQLNGEPVSKCSTGTLPWPTGHTTGLGGSPITKSLLCNVRSSLRAADTHLGLEADSVNRRTWTGLFLQAWLLGPTISHFLPPSRVLLQNVSRYYVESTGVLLDACVDVSERPWISLLSILDTRSISSTCLSCISRLAVIFADS